MKLQVLCEGWQWFSNKDNDLLNMKTDPFNRDSNKGIVNSNFQPYKPLPDNMKQLNEPTF
jgi:hypothetical protein